MEVSAIDMMNELNRRISALIEQLGLECKTAGNDSLLRKQIYDAELAFRNAESKLYVSRENLRENRDADKDRFFRGCIRTAQDEVYAASDKLSILKEIREKSSAYESVLSSFLSRLCGLTAKGSSSGRGSRPDF